MQCGDSGEDFISSAADGREASPETPSSAPAVTATKKTPKETNCNVLQEKITRWNKKHHK